MPTDITVGDGLVTLELHGSTSAVDGTRVYVQNVRNLEDRIFRAGARTAHRGMQNIRKSGSLIGNLLRKVHAIARSTRKIAQRYTELLSFFVPRKTIIFNFLSIFT